MHVVESSKHVCSPRLLLLKQLQQLLQQLRVMMQRYMDGLWGEERGLDAAYIGFQSTYSIHPRLDSSSVKLQRQNALRRHFSLPNKPTGCCCEADCVCRGLRGRFTSEKHSDAPFDRDRQALIKTWSKLQMLLTERLNKTRVRHHNIRQSKVTSSQLYLNYPRAFER